MLPASAVVGDTESLRTPYPPAVGAGSGMVSVGGGTPPGSPAIMGAINGNPDEEDLIVGDGAPRNASHPWDLGVRVPSSLVLL